MIRVIEIVVGILLLPLIWIGVKLIFEIEDRYLPSIPAVVQAAFDIRPSILTHAGYSLARLISGAGLGIAFGIGLGLAMHRFKLVSTVLLPSVQSMRAVPPLAMVPFFLLWFGFSEAGKFLLIVVGIGFNVAIASLQIADNIPEKYQIFFRGIGRQPHEFPFSFTLPRILESLLPTVRFSIATAAGLVVVAELLGSQVGLGYLMQSARSTFATHTIFLAAILFGMIAAFSDYSVRIAWRVLVYWGDRKLDLPGPPRKFDE